MTVADLLKIPNESLAALSDAKLLELLGPLVPQSREPDKDSMLLNESNRLLKQGAAIMAALAAETSVPPKSNVI